MRRIVIVTGDHTKIIDVAPDLRTRSAGVGQCVTYDWACQPGSATADGAS